MPAQKAAISPPLASCEGGMCAMAWNITAGNDR